MILLPMLSEMSFILVVSKAYVHDTWCLCLVSVTFPRGAEELESRKRHFPHGTVQFYG
jgi:hypothetical protein